MNDEDFLKKQRDLLVFVESQDSDFPIQMPLNDFKRLLDIAERKADEL